LKWFIRHAFSIAEKVFPGNLFVGLTVLWNSFTELRILFFTWFISFWIHKFGSNLWRLATIAFTYRVSVLQSLSFLILFEHFLVHVWEVLSTTDVLIAILILASDSFHVWSYLFFKWFCFIGISSCDSCGNCSPSVIWVILNRNRILTLNLHTIIVLHPLVQCDKVIALSFSNDIAIFSLLW